VKACLCVMGIAGLVLAVPSSQAAGLSPEEVAVLAPVDAMFQGMTKRDPAAIKAAALPGTIMVLMRDGKPEQMTIEAFADHFGTPTERHMEERIHDPLVRIDHDLAVVWAPFEFLVDGKKDHCGTDLFNVVHTEGKWVIAGIADTGSKGCAGK
jgi:Putative lumazine-binding